MCCAHPDFDDLTVEAVQDNNDISSVSRRVCPIMSAGEIRKHRWCSLKEDLDSHQHQKTNQ